VRFHKILTDLLLLFLTSTVYAHLCSDFVIIFWVSLHFYIAFVCNEGQVLQLAYCSFCSNGLTRFFKQLFLYLLSKQLAPFPYLCLIMSDLLHSSTLFKFHFCCLKFTNMLVLINQRLTSV